MEGKYLIKKKKKRSKWLILLIGVRSQVDLRGIIPSSFAHIFDSISQTTSKQFLVRASYLEIYNVNDLLLF